MPNTEHPSLLAMPEKVTPELLLAAKSFSDILGVPFCITDYVTDAAERFESLIPLSVRHRKAIVPLLKRLLPELDHRDKALVYSVLLQAIEEDPGQFYSYDAAIDQTVTPSKKSRLPRHRIDRHIAQNCDLMGDPFERYRNAKTNEEKQGALFDLFLEHVYKSPKPAFHNRINSKANPSEATDTVDYTGDQRSTAPASISEAHTTEGDAQAQPIPPALATEWELACSAIEALSSEMGEQLDASTLNLLLSNVEELKALADLAAEFPEVEAAGARRTLVETLSRLLPLDIAGDTVSALPDLNNDRLSEIEKDMGTLCDLAALLEGMQPRKIELEEAMSNASQHKAWSEMPDLSAEHQALKIEITDTYAQSQEVAVVLSTLFGITFSLSETGVMSLSKDKSGADETEPVVTEQKLENRDTEPSVNVPKYAKVDDELELASATDYITETANVGIEAVDKMSGSEVITALVVDAPTDDHDTGPSDIDDADTSEVLEATKADDSESATEAKPEADPDSTQEFTNETATSASTTEIPPGNPHLVMAGLVRDDQPAIAARFGLALEARGVKSPVGSDVLQVAASSRLSFDAYDSSSQEFEKMVNAAAISIRNLTPEEEEIRYVLLFGSMLRPAILMQNIQFRKTLEDLNLRRYGPILSGIQKALAELEYQFAPKIEDLAKAAGRPKTSRIEMTRQELRDWHKQAKGRSGPCQPSTYAVHKIVTNGDVGRLVTKILAGNVPPEELNTVIESYQPNLIETRVRELKRGAGNQSKGSFLNTSWRYMKRNIGEGIDLLMRYRDMQNRSKATRSHEIDQLPQRITLLKSKVSAAEEQLKATELFLDQGLDGALAYWLFLRLGEFDEMLSGQDITSYPTISAALGNDLDLLPTGCQPIMPESLRIDAMLTLGRSSIKDTLHTEDEAVLRAVLSEKVMIPNDAFKEKIETGYFAAALRLTQRLDDVEGAAAHVEAERQTRLKSLRTHVSDSSRRLKNLMKIDLSYQEEITRFIDRLDEALNAINGWSAGSNFGMVDRRGLVDAFQIPEIISDVEDLIAKVEVAIRTDQITRIEEIAEDRHSSGSAPEILSDIERLREEIDTLSPDVIEDRLALLRDGRPIGEIRENNSRAFETFFPDFVRSANAANWPKGPEGYQQSFNTESQPELKIAPDRHAAAGDLIEAWFKINRQLLSDVTRPAAIEALMEALTFKTPKASKPQRISGVKKAMTHRIRMKFQSKRFFCPPDFGSSSGGHYKLLVIGPNVLFEQINDHLEEQTPTIVLVANCMSVEKRREFAEGFHKHNIQAVLIDEALIAFIAVSSKPRLETLFDCALPFGRFDSYTTSAGKLPLEMFFGRDQEIKLIVSHEVDGCLVYGGRQLGKSALLAHVSDLNHKPENRFIVQWEQVKSLGATNNPASNIWGIIARKLSEFGIVPEREIDQAGVVQNIQNWINADPSGRIILLLDETDNFMSAEARNGYMNLMPLKSLMETTLRRFKVVFAGLHNVRRMLDEPNSPLAHLGKPICVGPLNATHSDKKSAQELIIEPMRAAGFAFENPRDVDDILAYVNHYPSLVQTFCKGLLQYIHRQRGTLDEGPLWKIPNSMIFKGEGFESIREEIRSKFQLTLDLDPRYALIANVMGLIRADFGDERVLRTGLTASEIRDETLKHWPEHIQPVGHRSFQALLKELSKLGVLSCIVSGPSTSRRYVLRTRQVAQMLGQEQEIIEALLALHDREAEVDYDASNYRKAYEPKGVQQRGSIAELKRSPLTDSQLNELLDPKEPGCRFVTGLPIMGLRDVPSAIEQIIAAAGGTWASAKSVTVSSATSAATFRKEIVSEQVTRGSSKIKLVFIRPDPADAQKLITSTDLRAQVQSGDVRPVFLLDATDETLRDIAVQREALVLLPWGHEMLRAYLHEVEANSLDTRELRNRMLELTGGIPSQLSTLIARNASQSIQVTPATIKEGADHIDASHFLPPPPHRDVLGQIESVDALDLHKILLEILSESGIKNPIDVITDLQMLGFIQSYDPDNGRLKLSAFGRFSQEAMKHDGKVHGSD